MRAAAERAAARAQRTSALTAVDSGVSPLAAVTESGSGRNTGNGTHHRSAVTGRYVKGSTAARHPNTTTTERG